MGKVKTCFLATRPQFFPAVVIPVGLGTSIAWHRDGAFDPWLSAVTLLAAVFYHAGMNVLNDYYDSVSGADELNKGALTPFTGGSRFIQNGLLSRSSTFALGAALVAAGSVLGLYLAWKTTWLLLAIGAVGLLTGYFYSAPPVFLAGRGLGELTVGLNFGVLTVSGAYLVQTSRLSVEAVVASLPVAFLITALLYINEFPDCESDELARKRTLVVRLGPGKARYGIPAIVGAAYLSVIAGTVFGYLPTLALLSLLTLPLAAPGVRGLMKNYSGGAALIPSIKSIILAHFSSGVLLIAAHIF